MSQIDLSTIQLIVENNMRNAGFQGQFEQGWKQTVTAPDGSTFTQQFNLQTLRDIISKSIVDAMTDAIATGTISVVDVQGVPIVAENTAIINITTNALVPSKPAARLGDTAITSDPNFIAWMAAVSAFCTAADSAGSLAAANTAFIAALASIGGPPVVVSSSITSGSSSVQIGG